jgi:hypothetical protein
LGDKTAGAEIKRHLLFIGNVGFSPILITRNMNCGLMARQKIPG